jgi:hypothetical protein
MVSKVYWASGSGKQKPMIWQCKVNFGPMDDWKYSIKILQEWQISKIHLGLAILLYNFTLIVTFEMLKTNDALLNTIILILW